MTWHGLVRGDRPAQLEQDVGSGRWTGQIGDIVDHGVAAAGVDPVTERHRARGRDQHGDGQVRRPLGVDRLEHAEVALDRVAERRRRLRTGRHDTAVDLLRDGERRRCRCGPARRRSPSSERSSPVTTTLGRNRRTSQSRIDPSATSDTCACGGVVEAAPRAGPLDPRRGVADVVVLVGQRDLVVDVGVGIGAAQFDRPPQPGRQRGVVGGHRSVGQLDPDLHVASSSRACANRSCGSRRAVSISPVSRSTRPHCRSPTIPNGPTVAASSRSPCIDLTG